MRAYRSVSLLVTWYEIVIFLLFSYVILGILSKLFKGSMWYCFYTQKTISNLTDVKIYHFSEKMWESISF